MPADGLDALTDAYLPAHPAAPTAYLGPADDRAAHRWRGAAVAFGRRADGLVTATCLGVTGAGPTEAAAVRDLDRVLRTGSFAGDAVVLARPPGGPA